MAEAQDTPELDLAERGAGGQRLDRRLFMQLLAFGDCRDTATLIQAMRETDASGALYADAHDPFGVALLTLAEDPGHFVDALPALLRDSPFAQLRPKPTYTMFGRTYAIGYEQDLQETLFTRPTRTALNRDWPWVIWYPLRRRGVFEQLDADRQREILTEHGRIGMRFGRADHAHDIRLACHGLDPNDNDFVIGLCGKALHPLSAVVQAMRRTTQTAQYLERLGPFFVGRAIWQSEEGE